MSCKCGGVIGTCSWDVLLSGVVAKVTIVSYSGLKWVIVDYSG